MELGAKAPAGDFFAKLSIPKGQLFLYSNPYPYQKQP